MNDMEKLLLEFGFIKESDDIFKYYYESEEKISLEFDNAWYFYVIENDKKLTLSRNADENFIKNIMTEVKRYE